MNYSNIKAKDRLQELELIAFAVKTKNRFQNKEYIDFEEIGDDEIEEVLKDINPKLADEYIQLINKL